MSESRNLSWIPRLGLALLGLARDDSAFACAVCFGDATSKMSRAIWPGVYLLLGLVALVLAPIAYLGWTWIRRESLDASACGGLARDQAQS